MAPPTPGELLATYGPRTPEQLAVLLGFRIERREHPPVLPGITVSSEYQPERTILLYTDTLHQLSTTRGDPFPRLEQWHIAHELYHGLSEASGVSSWRVRETEADLWADELLTLAPIDAG